MPKYRTYYYLPGIIGVSGIMKSIFKMSSTLALTLVRITGSKIGLILKGAQPSSNSFISKFLAADCYTTQWTKIWQKNEEKPCLKIYGGFIRKVLIDL